MGSDPTKVIRLVWASSNQFVGPTDYFTAQDPTLLPLLGLTSLAQVDPLLLTLSADGQPYVMDTTQRQLVPVEGAPKVPLTLFAMSMQAENTTHTRVDMVAATASGLFQLQLSFCRKLAGDMKRRYWNGDTCAPVVCQRQAQCTETQQLDAEGNCVCNPGYFAQGVDCVHCPLNSYCANQLSTRCPLPLVTTAMGQQSNRSCVCSKSSSALFYSNGNCPACAAPNFCPDQWHSVRCPGAALTNLATGIAQTTPAACLCVPGSTGVDCGPCPEGKYCPSSSTNMQKTGLILYGQYNVDPDATALCVVNRLRSDLANPPLSFTDYTLWYNAAVRPDDTLSISLLFQSVNAVPPQVTNLANVFAQPLPINTPCSFNMESRFPETGLVIRQFAPNLPLACDSGMVPAPGAASCMCAAGYESNVAEGCSQCQLDYYKPEAGAGTCTPCASGTVTLATGSSACVPQDQASRRRSDASRLWGRLYAVQMLFMLLATVWS